MVTEARKADVEAADEFLALEKFLEGPPPAWVNGTFDNEYQAVWNIVDADGVPLGTLKFSAKKTDTSVCAVNVIYRGRTLWRLDMDHSDVCHSNFHDGHLYGLPPLVCGPHEHAWPINRHHVLNQDLWKLPYRRPLDPAIKRLGQGLLWLASQISLIIGPDQRGFDGPTRADLFDMGGR